MPPWRWSKTACGVACRPVGRVGHGPANHACDRAMRERGVLERLPMFSEILEDGVRWEDGTMLHADVILWCTGFRSSLDHLAPLLLREDGGGITMTGRLATQVGKGSTHASGWLWPVRIDDRCQSRWRSCGKRADGIPRTSLNIAQ